MMSYKSSRNIAESELASAEKYIIENKKLRTRTYSFQEWSKIIDSINDSVCHFLIIKIM